MEVVVVDVAVDVDEEIVVTDTDTFRKKAYLVHVFSVFLPFLLIRYQN